MQRVLFEDHKVGQLAPISLSRPAFAISCGSYRLIDWASESGGSTACLVRSHLARIQAADFPGTIPLPAEPAGPRLWINAQLVPAASVWQRVLALAQAGQFGLVYSDDSVALAITPPTDSPLGQLTTESVSGHLESLGLARIEADLPLIEYPHDVVRHHLTSLQENLDHRLASAGQASSTGGGYTEVSDGVFVREGVKLGQYLVTDTTRGPVVIEAGASIGPFCLLSGPLHIGAKARLIEHSVLKDSACVGHTTKIGGEIEAAIVEPYTNKQHHGFLGHSYLGSWINLGAGTSNSDLKNTYGRVRMEYGDRKVPTGMQFVGCFVGDYAKTAINTSIFTGKTIGVCSMVYGFATTNVPSYVNYARSFGQSTELPADVMVATQARMFARRGVEQRQCDVQLLRDMFDLTRHERQMAGESLPPEPLSL